MVKCAELLDLAQDIEDGVFALDMLSTVSSNDYDEDEIKGAFQYVVTHVRDDLTTLRAELTGKAVVELDKEGA